MTDNHAQPSAANWQIQTLFDSAGVLESTGDAAGADRIYEKIIEAAPYHVPSLLGLAASALQRQDNGSAQSLLDRALATVSDASLLYERLARLLATRGSNALALEWLSRAAETRPDDMLLIMNRARLLEALGRSVEAVAFYARILDSEPSMATISGDDTNRNRFAMIRSEALKSFRLIKFNYLADCVAKAVGSEELPARILEAVRHLSGLQAPVYSDPLQRPDWFYMPGVEPKPFFDLHDHDWVQKLQSHTDAIREELVDLLRGDADLEPYVQIDRNLDAMQWKTLNHSSAWSSFHVYKGGKRLEHNSSRVPRTMAALEGMPFVDIEEQAPEVFFSILHPGAHIPPHFGLANYKLAVHLPLLVPESCAIRVGKETRTWTEGQCLIFDDSFEHEAWNKSDRIRVVLIMEIWNPELTEVERAGIRALVKGLAQFKGIVSNT